MEQKGSHPSYPVTARVSPDLVRTLPLYFGERVRAAIDSAGPPDDEGWITLTPPSSDWRPPASTSSPWGEPIEVLEPEPPRRSVIDFAQQVVDFYRP